MRYKSPACRGAPTGIRTQTARILNLLAVSVLVRACPYFAVFQLVPFVRVLLCSRVLDMSYDILVAPWLGPPGRADPHDESR